MSYTKPGLRESIKNRVLAGSKGGKPGQWSARKAQLVAQQYKKAGGGYTGSKTSTQGSKATGERYLPKKAREALNKKEYAATSAKKRRDTKAGKQFSRQPKSIAKKTARYR
jgi:UTP:GlnB (protein PII) uridylyltransferase